MDTYGERPLREIDDAIVRTYRKGGGNGLSELRVMFNDAATPDAGRLVTVNPFAGLRRKRSRGRKDLQPPDRATVVRMIDTADRLTPPSFSAWLFTGVETGMRPGELDGLRWQDCDFTPGEEAIRIEQQYVAKIAKFAEPKHGSRRTITMPDSVRDRLLALPRESEWVFTTLRGHHYAPSTRNHHWNRVRCAVGLADAPCYLCTRHHYGWFALNVFELPAARHRAQPRPRRRRCAGLSPLRPPGRSHRPPDHPRGVPAGRRRWPRSRHCAWRPRQNEDRTRRIARCRARPRYPRHFPPESARVCPVGTAS